MSNEHDRQPIEYACVPRMRPRVARFVILVVVVVVAASIVLGMQMTSSNVRTGIAILVVTAIAVTTAISFGLTYRHLNRPLQGIREETLTPIERALYRHDRDLPFVLRRASDLWDWDELSSQLTTPQRARPITIVDQAIQSTLDRIERPTHFLEREPILTSGALNKRTTILLVGFYAAVAMMQLTTDRPFLALFMLFLAALFLVTIPALRDRLRNFRYSDGHVVAGQGSVSDHRDRLWTVDDSMMIVQTRDGTPPIFVTLTGPAGAMTLTFMDETDPDFIRLWQRWNHPHPRPELAAQS